MNLPLKLVLEFPIYRKPTKKLIGLFKHPDLLRIGSIIYEESQHTLVFTSSVTSKKTSISDVYFKDPKGKVHIELFRKFRSVLNLIDAVTTSNETKVSIDVVETNEPGEIHANVQLAITSNSLEEFTRIVQHLKLLENSET